MPDCPTCGLPVREGERFCNACGSKLPKLVKQVFCPVCGNTVFEDAVKCNLCGTKLNSNEESTSAAEVIAQQQEALKNPSMDELFVPVITDEMLGLNEVPIPKEELPTMDSVQMPGQKKQEPQEQQKVSHRNDPLPMPTIIGNDGNVTNPGAVVPEPAVSQPVNISKPQAAPTVNIQKTPQVAPTPTVNNTYQQQPANQYQQYGQQQNNNQYQQQYAQQGGNPYQQYGQQPANNAYDSQATTVLTPDMMNTMNANYGQQNGYNQGVQQQNPYPQQNPYSQSNSNAQQSASKPKKGGLSPVQIILIAAIVVVILVDVFVVFKDKIFGGGDKEKNSAAVVSVVDFDDIN